MSGATKKRLQAVADLLQGKELFPKKVENAQRMLGGLPFKLTSSLKLS